LETTLDCATELDELPCRTGSVKTEDADELLGATTDDELDTKPSPWFSTEELADTDVATLAVELATTAELATLVAAEVTAVELIGLVKGDVEGSPLPAPPPQAANQVLDTNIKPNFKDLSDLTG